MTSADDVAVMKKIAGVWRRMGHVDRLAENFEQCMRVRGGFDVEVSSGIE